MHGLLHLMQALPDVLRVQALQQAINHLHSLYGLHWSAFMAQEDRASLQASNGCRHALSPSLCGKAPGVMHLLLHVSRDVGTGRWQGITLCSLRCSRMASAGARMSANFCSSL